MRRRRIRKIPKLFSVLKIIGIILLLLVVFYLVKNREYFNSTLSGKGRVAVLFYSPKDSVLAVLDTAGGLLNLFSIPGDLYAEVPKGYGSYRFNSVYKLGELDGQGSKLVSETASNLFAINIDAVSLIPEDVDINNIRKYFFKAGRSNFDLLKFWWNARNLKPKDTRIVNLKETDSVSDLVLADGSVAYKFDSFFYDRQEAPAIRDSLVVSEGLKVEVMNGSSVNGMGERISRFLTNSGLNVLSVSNADPEPTVCRIKYDEKFKTSYSLYRLVKDFSCRFEVYGPQDVRKSDLTIIIGESFKDKNF